MTHRACGLLLALLGVTGCPGARPPRATGDGAVAAPQAASEPAPSMRLARRWIVTSRLDPANIGTFTRLTPAQRTTLDDLVSRSTVPLEVYASRGHLLLRLSARHPAGPMDLLLQEDRAQIRGHLPQSKLSFDAPLDHLPDLLDGHSNSTCADFGAELSATASPPRSTAPVKTAGLDATLSFRYLPRRGHPLSWPIQQQVQILFADSPRPFFAVFQQPLLHVALPLLQARRGVLVLESLAWNITAAPLAWSTTTSNEGQPGGQPPTFRTSVEDLGWVWIPSHLMAVSRSGYHEGRPGPGSSQLVPATQLVALRSTRSAGALTVENRGGSSAMVYADGILVGRVADRGQLAIKGLPAGYYQLYAVSPSGVRCWGPHQLYVPGPWTLR